MLSALQGHLKRSPKLIESFGEAQLIEWRRSYHVKPPGLNEPGIFPKLDSESFELNIANTRDFNLLENVIYPDGESLKDCEERAYGYWKEAIAPRVKAGYRVLIVAHANTIRALVKVIDNISDDMISQLKIPNGVPLVYTLDENLEPIRDILSFDELGFQAKYLVSARNHKKVNIFSIISLEFFFHSFV